MSKLAITNTINIYSDQTQTNSPLKNNVNWQYSTLGIEVNEPESKSVKIAGSQTELIFSGEVITSVDNTTAFDLEVNPGVANTYQLNHVSGTAPGFRTLRAISTTDLTEFTLSISGDILTIEATPFITTNILLGDIVRLDSIFNTANQGTFSIIAKTANSISVINPVAIGETVIAGLSFASEFMVYSSNGVQVGQKLKILEGFSTYTLGTYEIVDVAPNYLIFNSYKSLPIENAILSEVLVLKNSKSFVYIESDVDCSLIVDGSEVGQIKPFIFGTQKRSGVYMKSGDLYSLSLRNDSTNTANILVISAE